MGVTGGTDRFGGTGQIDRYATHLGPLTDAVMRTSGSILEMGCGYYSTPVLHAIANNMHRFYVALASDKAWAKKVREWTGATVDVVDDWLTWRPPQNQWSVCLLDHEQHTKDRIRHLPALAKVCEFVVVHDADACINHLHWEECARGYTDIVIHKKFSPWTVVMRSKHVR